MDLNETLRRQHSQSARGKRSSAATGLIGFRRRSALLGVAPQNRSAGLFKAFVDLFVANLRLVCSISYNSFPNENRPQSESFSPAGFRN
jgi:hypothetical protein